MPPSSTDRLDTTVTSTAGFPGLQLIQPARAPIVRIRPTTGWGVLNLAELWAYRDLLFILAGRDIKLRYKQTALGVIWVVLQPLLAALIFAVIFGRFAHLPSDGIPYLLFVFAGMLPWNYFSQALTRAGNSLITDSKLISKVYFPRLLIPTGSTIAILLDFSVSLVVLFILEAIYGFGPTWHIVFAPLFLIMTTVGALGVSFWLSALNVKYRDFVYALPFIVQIWMFASPVAYATKLLPTKYYVLYGLNPVVGYVEGFRWALLGRGTLSLPMVFSSVIVSCLLFVSGLLFFKRIEREFADVV
jgi:lipopolysaccharide transport system permease protein